MQLKRIVKNLKKNLRQALVKAKIQIEESVGPRIFDLILSPCLEKFTIVRIAKSEIEILIKNSR